MSYKEWKRWFLAQPWLLRWFVILVLIRPIIDNFYYLKNISPFFSPLNIVGVLTPIFAIAALVKWKTAFNSPVDFYFKLWTVLIVVSLCFLFIFDPLQILFYEFLLKLTAPVYIYFFVRLFIRSKQDLHGILQTFIYSSVAVAVLFLYELIVNPIRVVESRGLERIQGNYGDVLNYSIYLTQSFLIMCYFYFSQNKIKSQSTRLRNVFIVGALAILMLFKIHHSASFIVFLALIILFVSFSLKESSGTFIMIIMLFGGLIYAFGNEIVEEEFNPLFKTDIAVYKGEKENDRLLHGRVGRWKMMWEEFSSSPMQAQFFGIPLKLEYPYYYISTNAHNDFFRILLFTGFIGLIVYLLLLINIYSRFRYLPNATKFLATGSFTILVLYSMSTTPTMYVPLLYVLYSVFAYVSLPIKEISLMD